MIIYDGVSEQDTVTEGGLSDFSCWLKSNRLSDTIDKLDGNVKLQGLLNLNDQDLRYVIQLSQNYKKCQC